MFCNHVFQASPSDTIDKLQSTRRSDWFGYTRQAWLFTKVSEQINRVNSSNKRAIFRVEYAIMFGFCFLVIFFFRIHKSARKETARSRKDRKRNDSQRHRMNLKAAKENLDEELNRLTGVEKRTMIGTLVTASRILKDSLVYEE